MAHRISIDVFTINLYLSVICINLHNLCIFGWDINDSVSIHIIINCIC